MVSIEDEHSFDEWEIILTTQNGFERYLDLSNNNLSGSIPASFLAAKKELTEPLTILLNNNGIEGSIPRELARFDKLFIDLTGNAIDHIPDDLCKKTKW